MKVFICRLLVVALLSPLGWAIKLQPDGSCPLLTLLPFTDLREGPPDLIAKPGVTYYGYGQWTSAQALGEASFSYMATAQLAKDHFNARDTSVVPQLANLGSCNITFPDTWFIDSAYSRVTSVDSVIALSRESPTPDDAICAVVGPIDPRANEGVSVLTENFNIPQVNFGTLDQRLSRQQDFPTFSRAIPEAKYFSRAIAEYVQRDVFVRDYVGIIYDQSDYGEQYEDPLEDAEGDLGYSTLTEHIVEDDLDTFYSALGEVVAEGFRTVIFVTDRPQVFATLAEVAVELGIVGDEYLWIFSGDLFPPEYFENLQFEVDSAPDKLIRGSAFFTNHDPFLYKPEGDAFLNAWKQQGQEHLDRLAAQHPLDPSAPGYFVGGADYFQTTVPSYHSSFLFDAVMAAGIAACESQAKQTDHVAEVFNVDFDGASGHVKFVDGENGRDPDGVTFGMYNVRLGSVDPATNMRSYESHLTALYNGEEDVWKKVEGTEFIFYDGTTNEPMPLKTVVDANYLSKSAQVLGLTLVSLALLIILVSMAWVFIRRKERIVTASQPQFLYLMCFGAILQAVSLIFISFDESYGWDEDQLSKACAAFPWFFVIGYLLQYCAVFSKLWRLSKLLSLRRRAVDIKQVLLPFALIIFASLIVLVVWQIVEPLEWERVQTSPEEAPLTTYGQCSIPKNGVVPFIVPLAFLFAVIIAMTLAISWKMKDVQSELSEAKWIFIAIYSHLQIWAIGIPCYLILDGVSRDATYIMSMALVFIFSTTFVCFVIGPKLIEDVRKNYLGIDTNKKGKSPQLSIKGGAQTHVSGLDSGVPTAASSHFNSGGSSKTGEQYGSTASYSEDKLKILQLEAEVEELKNRLGSSSRFLVNEANSPSVAEQPMNDPDDE